MRFVTFPKEYREKMEKVNLHSFESGEDKDESAEKNFGMKLHEEYRRATFLKEMNGRREELKDRISKIISIEKIDCSKA